MQRHAEAVATVHNVQVLYITFLDGIEENFRIEDRKIHGVDTTIVYCKKGFSGWQGKRIAFKKGIEYLQSRNRFDIDIVHHNIIWNSGWQARYLHKKFSFPYIITEHWTGYDKSIRSDQPLFLKAFSKYVVKNASIICPVSENLAGVMREYGLSGNYEVVPNVVDTVIFHPGKKSEEMIHFLHVSTLDDAHKNISGILRVWKQFSDTVSNVHLTIGGDGPYEHFQRMAVEHGIRIESITFFGEKQREEIANLMAVSHCLLMFSNYENLPCVIIEAMASGMAVISTDVGGIAEHVDSSKGLLLPARDEKELLKNLHESVHLISRLKVLELQDYAIEHFSVKSIAGAFDHVYQSVLLRK